jgi:hypothetical protein
MNIGLIIKKAIDYFGNDTKRINHFMKVYSFAKTIGELEGLSDREQSILEVTAVLHDIGIKNAEAKYNSSAGKYQEQEGPAVAQDILTEFDFDREFVERVKFLIGHHHTYDNIQGMDYQILVEADFIVNIYEDNMQKEAIENVINKIFVTKAGTEIAKTMFL